MVAKQPLTLGDSPGGRVEVADVEEVGVEPPEGGPLDRPAWIALSLEALSTACEDRLE